MKYIKFVVIPLTPFIFGYLCNLLLGVGYRYPLVISLYKFLLVAFLLFWYISGKIYSELKVPKPIAVLIGNSIGLLSLAVFIWQFLFETEQSRNSTLAGFSLLSNLPGMNISVKIAILFEPVKNHYGLITLVGSQIIGYLVMVIVFLVGLLRKNYLNKKAAIHIS